MILVANYNLNTLGILVLFSFNGIYKKPFLYYVFFAVQSESEIRFGNFAV